MNVDRIRREAIKAKDSLAEIIVEVGTEAPDLDVPPADPPDEPEPEVPAESHIVVGYAEGKAGEVVRVEVLGSTHVEVNGFALGVGLPRELQLVKSGPTDGLKELLQLDSPQVIQKRQVGASWRQNFLQVGVLFFATVFSEEEIDGSVPVPPKKPKRTIVDRRIPTLMPIYEMEVKIPADAKVGDKWELDAEKYHGHPLRYADGRVKWLYYPSMYTTNRHVSRHGIVPKFVSGWIEVTE